ncbi:MAG: fimbrillin family protein [Bacteroidetes bacterium]|uniref:Fimbrillin family protein n=1 Tax=Candidatus Limisoma faecipullorum TaxID=2840854 RepID=A0A9D9NJ78_9BACT|nr:fimbrillin family protein [Candidatus Limisoma faecipullorum]
MKKIISGIAVLMLLVSCSKEEVIDVNHDGDEITFDVVTNSATRAADVYCNNNMPKEFYVSAISDGMSYIDEDHIANENGSWVNKSGVRYWPETAVDFYAYYNDNNSYSWSVENQKAVAKFVDFTVNDNVADQQDLIYAVKTSQSKPGENDANTPVALNFRHALSQIVFQAKNTNANLYVEISGVDVVNVGNTNTFTFPSVDTDNNIVDHTGATADYAGVDGWGTWAELTSGTASYAVAFDAVAVKGDNTVVALTTTDDSEKPGEYNANTMLLLPQTTTAWDAESKLGDTTGSYFLVNCIIKNVKDGSGVAGDEDVYLWGAANAPKKLAIPVAFNWEQGKKYIYTLVFGEGNGGYEPDPEDPTPDPVLVPITFTVTVDDFVTPPATEVESDK